MWRRIAGSSASGMPALTSSMCAPAATCAIASASTRLKSPFFISSASSLRPVGLIRSPIITKGRSNPITTSLVAELMKCRHVRVLLFSARASTVARVARRCIRTRAVRPRPPPRRRDRRPQGRASRRHSPTYCVGAVCPATIAARRSPSGSGGESSDARRAAPLAGRHLGGDVAPRDHGHLRHSVLRAGARVIRACHTLCRDMCAVVAPQATSRTGRATAAARRTPSGAARRRGRAARRRPRPARAGAGLSVCAR